MAEMTGQARPLAVISGAGLLPSLVAATCRDEGRSVHVVRFPGSAAAVGNFSTIEAEFERPGQLFRKLKLLACSDVVFAGGVRRPRLDGAKFDSMLRRHADTLLPALDGGDDGTLRAIRTMFETEGFRIVGSHELVPELLPEPGVPTRVSPSPVDKADGRRAEAIHGALGGVDVGQGVVVAGGLCLGIETAQGTDRMLEFVADTIGCLRTNPNAGKGVFFKAPKSGQDRQMDMPTVGPATVEAAAAAGLAGLMLEAGGVIVIDLPSCIRRADDTGMFLWVRTSDESGP